MDFLLDLTSLEETLKHLEKAQEHIEEAEASVDNETTLDKISDIIDLLDEAISQTQRETEEKGAVFLAHIPKWQPREQV